MWQVDQVPTSMMRAAAKAAGGSVEIYTPV